MRFFLSLAFKYQQPSDLGRQLKTKKGVYSVTGFVITLTDN